MTHIPSIAQLQSDWFGLSDVERAMAIQTIKQQSGISTRKIAAQLHLSDPLLRHLMKGLKASALDQALARQGKISTNELVRRAEAVLVGACTDQPGESSALDRDMEIRTAADLIYNWLPRDRLFVPALEIIIKEAQRKFRLMKEAGPHPSAVATPSTSLSQIIARTEPLPDHTIDIVAWFANWLCRWMLHAVPDEIRDASLHLALEKQRAAK